jgi:hypothetical protein
MIKECHKEMSRKKAAGVDEVTKEADRPPLFGHFDL